MPLLVLQQREASMQQTQAQQSWPAEPVSGPLTPLPPDSGQPADDGDDSPDAIFLRAVSEIPTQPLPTLRSSEEEIVGRYFSIFVLTVVLCLLVSSIAAIVNQPVVTVTLLPVHKSMQLTTALPLPTRQLAPVTLTKSLTAQTTGKGHQDARAATGTLTLYNGLFTSQTIAVGTVFTGADGVKVVTDASVTIPAATPPQFAEAAVSAHAVNAGQTGNIPAGDVHTTVANGVLVNNRAFGGGRDVRDFQAVAQHDLDTLSAKVQQQLTQAMPHAFNLAPGEALQPTDCTTHLIADHGAGDEAPTVSVKARKTCSAIAYNQEALQQQATAVFNATRPGHQFELVSSVRTTVVSVTPLIVRMSGSWESVFTPDDEQWFAQHMQGETPAQARAYLLRTGLMSRVTITQTQSLPDWYHIKFLILIGV